MATNVCTVSGTLAKANDQFASRPAKLVFRLNGYDIDLTNDEVIVPRDVEATVGVDGAISIDLWPTQAGKLGRVYSVKHIIGDPPHQVTINYGNITVPDQASVNLEELLDSPEQLKTSFWLQLTDDQVRVATGAKIYPTVADGIAAVSVGDVFMVPITPSGGLDVREKTGASTSTSIGEILPPTQSATDTTAGRLLKVGDAGILGPAIGPDIADCNDPVWGAKEKFGTSTLNSPEKGTYNTAGVLESQKWNDNAGFQLARTFFPIAAENNAYFRVFRDGAFGDWHKVYTTGNAVGTIAGGALIESGSTANGSYTKFADGTMICRHQLPVSATGTPTWTFPQEFAAPPDVIPAAIRGFPRAVTIDFPSATDVELYVWLLDGSRVTTDVSVIAYGEYA